MNPKVSSARLSQVVLIYLKNNKMNNLKSIYRKLEGQCLDPSFMYGYEAEFEAYEYEFEGDSLSQVDCIESNNESKSLVSETLKNELK
jgi:hypothetical protein